MRSTRSRVVDVDRPTDRSIDAMRRDAMDDARHTSATRGMASDARTNRAKAYAYACGLAIGAFAVVAGAMRDGRAGTMTAVARRAMTGDGGTREGATAMTEDEKGTTTTTRTDEDEDANEDEDVGEMERRFTRCAGQFKKLLADADAYFEPGLKAKMYGLYKRCTKDFDREFEGGKTFGALDVVARAKYEAWKEVKDLTREEAMERYVRTFEMWGARRDSMRPSTATRNADGFTEEDRLAAEEFHARDEEEKEVYANMWSINRSQSRPAPLEDDDEASQSASNSGELGALSAACKAGDEDAAMKAIEGGADVNERDALGRAPLHWCADGGHSKIAMHLALLKADVNARDRYGQTPLHFSVNLDDTETVNLFLDWGADPSIADEEGETPESLGIWQLAAAREENATA